MASHYPYRLNPRRYPDDARRPVRVPTWSTFGDQPQFITLRDLSQTTWREDLDLHTVQFELGRILWPSSGMLYAKHVKDAVEEIRARGLFLFDLWSFVPGSPMEGMWSNLTPPPGMVRHLQHVLGERFLGMDVGEQDGRYIWATAEQQCPNPQSRYRQDLMFQRHFQKLGDELGNRLSALVSLCFGHYLIKEGNVALIGAETAQALPNSQLYYAFIRGAGRQYGVHWFGNASVWNRWGWKSYGPPRRDVCAVGDCVIHAQSGPEQGTSLALLKRLLYTHYLYNCVAMGFESGWLIPDPEPDAGPAPDGGAGSPNVQRHILTPIGRIQRAAVEFVATHGQPGVMHSPVALLIDFFAGWAPPRHLYSKYVFQVWGGMPYEAGDYLTHALLGLLYPGYADAGYFRDERGFLSATPYGDMADVLLSDAAGFVLQQYGLIVAAGGLDLTRELRDKLRAFVAGGGHLIVTAANARGLLPDLEIEDDAPERMDAGAVIRWADGTAEAESRAFELARVCLPTGTEILARCGEAPAVVRLVRGAGKVTLLLSPFGLEAEPRITGPLTNAEETTLPCPYGLLRHARRTLDDALREQQLFAVGDDLGFVTCRKGAGDYTLGIYNNALAARPFRIESRCGTLIEMRERVLDRSEREAVGCWPTGAGAPDCDAHDAEVIAGGDIRIFSVRVAESGVRCLPASSPPPRPRDRLLGLHATGTIQEAILARPTFFEHFDGVKVDWTYFHQRDREQVKREVGWLARQQVRVVADFSAGLNLYPDLTLFDNFPPHDEASLAAFEDVFDKLRLVGARHAVLTLHRGPENHWSAEQVLERFAGRLGSLAERAAARGVMVCLQPHPRRPCARMADMRALVDRAGSDNLRLALNTGHLIMTGETLGDALAAAGPKLAAVLVSVPRHDAFGQTYDAHAPVAESGLDLHPLAGLDAWIALDASYNAWDEEYADCVALDTATRTAADGIVC